jgi:threonine synthase
MMAKLSSEQLERGVICSSAGNHAQGVALSAQRLGCDAVIVMPVTTPEIKVIDSYMPGVKFAPLHNLFCCRGRYLYFIISKTQFILLDSHQI